MWRFTQDQMTELKLYPKVVFDRKLVVYEAIYQFEIWKRHNVRLGMDKPVEIDETKMFTNKYNRGRPTT